MITRTILFRMLDAILVDASKTEKPCVYKVLAYRPQRIDIVEIIDNNNIVIIPGTVYLSSEKTMAV